MISAQIVPTMRHLGSLRHPRVVSVPDHGFRVIFEACRFSWFVLSVSAKLLVLSLEISAQTVELRIEIVSAWICL